MEGFGDFGDFEIEVDDSAATARAARIEAARKAGKEYEAKIEDPGWFDDPAFASRSKGPARPALFSLHKKYLERRFEEVVEGGLKLSGGNDGKEQQEVLDLVMRAAMRCGQGQRAEVVELAKQWRDFPNLPALSFVSARILFDKFTLTNAAIATSSDTPSTFLTEALEASLASLRLHPQQTAYHPLLSLVLRPTHPLLSDIVDEQSKHPYEDPARRASVEEELVGVDVGETAKETLAKVLWLRGGEKEDDDEGVGRDVRSL